MLPLRWGLAPSAYMLVQTLKSICEVAYWKSIMFAGLLCFTNSQHWWHSALAVRQPELVTTQRWQYVVDRRLLTLAGSSAPTLPMGWVPHILVFPLIEELKSDHDLPLLQWHLLVINMALTSVLVMTLGWNTELIDGWIIHPPTPLKVFYVLDGGPLLCSFGSKKRDYVMGPLGGAGGHMTHNWPVWIDPQILTLVVLEVVINMLWRMC